MTRDDGIGELQIWIASPAPTAQTDSREETLRPLGGQEKSKDRPGDGDRRHKRQRKAPVGTRRDSGTDETPGAGARPRRRWCGNPDAGYAGSLWWWPQSCGGEATTTGSS